MRRRWPTVTSSTGLARGISLHEVESSDISPEPDEAERKAILAALAAEEAERSEEAPVSAWAELLLPERGGEEPEP
jgi:hypothetical protein